MTTTDDALRPRRSVLYMPGANERALEKAATLPADALILDLEDAVAPDAKAEARERVCEAAASDRYGLREVTIRANGLGTPWHDDDLRAIAAAGPAAVVVPKIDSPDAVHAIEKALEAGGAPDHTRIWAMLETPQAMLHAEAVASASERLSVLVMGTNDLAKELQAAHVPGRGPLLTGLGLSSVVSARFVYPVPLPGQSPFATPSGSVGVNLLTQLIGFTALVVLVLPEVVLAVVAIVRGSVGLGVVALVVGLVLGSVLLVVGVRLGGRLYDRRAPELLQAVTAQA